MQAPRAQISRGRGSGTIGPTARVLDRSSDMPFVFHGYEGAMPQATGAVPGRFASMSYMPHVPAVPLQPNEFGSHPQDLARRLEPYPQGIRQSLAPVSSDSAYVSQPGNGLGSDFFGGSMTAWSSMGSLSQSRNCACTTSIRYLRRMERWELMGQGSPGLDHRPLDTL